MSRMNWKERQVIVFKVEKILHHFGVEPHHPGDERWWHELARAIAYRKIRKVTDWNMDSEKVERIIGDDSPPLVNLRDANIVTSEYDEGDDYPGAIRQHMPVLDVDIPVQLVPSTNVGHYHLYFGIAVAEEKYWAMLDAMTDAGVVQAAWVDASKNRGYSAVRLPWIKKESVE